MQSLSFYHGVLPFQLRDIKKLLKSIKCSDIMSEHIAILADDVIFGKEISVSVKCFLFFIIILLFFCVFFNTNFSGFNDPSSV